MAEERWTIRSAPDIGRAIAAIRGSSGLTQQDLAARVGLTRDYVAQIERGRTGRLLDHLLRILRRLGATVTITFEAPDDEPSDGGAR